MQPNMRKGALMREPCQLFRPFLTPLEQKTAREASRGR